MKSGIIGRAACVVLCACACAVGAAARQTEPSRQADAPAAAGRELEPRVPLAEQAVAYDSQGRAAVAGRLVTQTLAGTREAPARNSRIVVENRAGVFYTFASGWATFYGADGVRCGEGAWTLDALAPGERAEVDTPGLRLTCSPTTWRLAAADLLPRTPDEPTPRGTQAPDAQAMRPGAEAAPAAADPLPPLEINVNGKTIPVQPGNPLEIIVGKERVRIIVNRAP